jgi:DNA-binding Lrp family transcriptional regulator
MKRWCITRSVTDVCCLEMANAAGFTVSYRRQPSGGVGSTLLAVSGSVTRIDEEWLARKIRMTGMVTAIVFVKAEVARIPEVAEEIAALSGVSEVYSVTGTIDLIAMIRVATHDQVAEVVADRLNKVSGVVSTETHIAFRAYSAHDLEAAFSLGG